LRILYSMKTDFVISCRLLNQQIAETKFKTPAQIVHYMVAMQAQEFLMAKWAIGLRLNGVKEKEVEKAFNDGKILRTHMMRPTWHFVSPTDIRWMQALTAPRVHAGNAYMNKKMELDPKIFKKCNDTLIKNLEGGNHLTRTALKDALGKVKIVADGIRLSLLMMHAELEGLICSGAMQDKQFTYALLEERVSSVKPFTKEEALAELVKRYFITRGPATLKDFAWWSGLTMKEAKEGYEDVKSNFVKEIINREEYIFFPATYTTKIDPGKATFLLPDYDEYAISYKDRSAIFSEYNTGTKGRGNAIFSHMIILEGKVQGTWRKVKNKDTFDIEVSPANPLSKTKQLLLTNAVKRYNDFIS
jgi:hypothetical protein